MPMTFCIGTAPGADDADDFIGFLIAVHENLHGFTHDVFPPIGGQGIVLVHKADLSGILHIVFVDQPAVKQLQGNDLLGALVDSPDQRIGLLSF